MDEISKAYESAWQQIIKPEKQQYSDQEIGPDVLASSTGFIYSRKELNIPISEGYDRIETE